MGQLELFPEDGGLENVVVKIQVTDAQKKRLFKGPFHPADARIIMNLPDFAYRSKKKLCYYTEEGIFVSPETMYEIVSMAYEKWEQSRIRGYVTKRIASFLRDQGFDV